MEMHPDDAHKTSIALILIILVLKNAFWLQNPSCLFQHIMSIVLLELSELSIAVYINDVVVASKTFDEHLKKLELVFN